MRKTAKAAPVADKLNPTRKRSQWRDVWKRLRRNKLAMVGMVIVLLLILMAVFADFIAPYDYDAADFGSRLEFPSKEHLLGTDNFGRDLLSRIIYGGRTSLLVALTALVMSLIVGGFFGATAATTRPLSCVSSTLLWPSPVFC